MKNRSRKSKAASFRRGPHWLKVGATSVTLPPVLRARAKRQPQRTVGVEKDVGGLEVAVHDNASFPPVALEQGRRQLPKDAAHKVLGRVLAVGQEGGVDVKERRFQTGKNKAQSGDAPGAAVLLDERGQIAPAAVFHHNVDGGVAPVDDSGSEKGVARLEENTEAPAAGASTVF